MLILIYEGHIVNKLFCLICYLLEIKILLLLLLLYFSAKQLGVRNNAGIRTCMQFQKQMMAGDRNGSPVKIKLQSLSLTFETSSSVKSRSINSRCSICLNFFLSFLICEYTSIFSVSFKRFFSSQNVPRIRLSTPVLNVTLLAFTFL